MANPDLLDLLNNLNTHDIEEDYRGVLEYANRLESLVEKIYNTHVEDENSLTEHKITLTSIRNRARKVLFDTD